MFPDRLLRLCALIWELATGQLKPGQQNDENNDAAWIRHMGKVKAFLKDQASWDADLPLRSACVFLSGILKQHGLDVPPDASSEPVKVR